MTGAKGKMAKFRRDQCVVFRGTKHVTRIDRVGIVDSENNPVYWVQGGSGYVPEKYLRELTDHEIGPRRTR
jgi:hypothetical protein